MFTAGENNLSNTSIGKRQPMPIQTRFLISPSEALISLTSLPGHYNCIGLSYNFLSDHRRCILSLSQIRAVAETSLCPGQSIIACYIHCLLVPRYDNNPVIPWKPLFAWTCPNGHVSPFLSFAAELKMFAGVSDCYRVDVGSWGPGPGPDHHAWRFTDTDTFDPLLWDVWMLTAKVPDESILSPKEGRPSDPSPIPLQLKVCMSCQDKCLFSFPEEKKKIRFLRHLRCHPM